MNDELGTLLSLPVSSLCCVCRLCAAVVDASSAVTIFSTTQSEDDLVNKIKKYLPISVGESDPFPKTICKTCADQVNKFHDLVQKSVIFEQHLHRTQNPRILEEIDVQAELEIELKNLKNTLDVSYDIEELEFLARGLNGSTDIFSNPGIENGAPCKVCGDVLPNFEQCMQHQKTHINDNRCVICNFLSESDIDINLHLAKHFGDSSPPKIKEKSKPTHVEPRNEKHCMKCDLKFSTIESAVEHCKAHRPTDISCYSCIICAAPINLTKLDEHVTEHFRENIIPLTCDDCEIEYSDEKTLKYHRCNAMRKYKCTKCKLGFKTEARLRFHEEFHESKQTYCELCKKDFKFESRMFLHLTGAHNGERDNPFCCDTCGRTFRWLRTLRDHQLTHTNDRPFPCRKCDARFFSETALTAHATCHDTAPRLHCLRCDYSTCRKLNLQKHVSRFHKQLESSQIVSRCLHCQEVFPNSGHAKLEKHKHDVVAWDIDCFMERMIVTKLFQCERCNRNFVSEVELSKHRRQHQTDDSSSFYRCRLCEVGFSRHDSLVRHQKVHRGVTSLYTGKFSVLTVILCDICEIECIDYTQLLNHKERGNCLEKKKSGLIRPKKCLVMPRLRPLKASQLNMNAEGLFECLTCKRTYKNRRRYRLHLATHGRDAL